MWCAYVDYKTKLRDRKGTDSCKESNCVDGIQSAGHVKTTAHFWAEGREQVLSFDSIDVSLNESFLWHGTSPVAAESICRDNFSIVPASGLKYGPGVYFAEDVGKSLGYATGAGVDRKCVLLCRVTCGEYYYTESSSDPKAPEKVLDAGMDSVLTNSGGIGPREFVVQAPEQAYPEFLLELSKIGDCAK